MADATHERLTVCAKPKAVLALIETQPSLFREGTVVERYATPRGIVYEKHIALLGQVTWYRVKKWTS